MLNKKVAGLIMSGLMAISVVGCGKYSDKCNPEYYMLGQTIMGCEGFGETLEERVENTLLYVNEDEENKVTLTINNVGDTFKFNDEIYRVTIEKFIFSKKNNDDKQFSNAQYGLLVKLNSILYDEYEEFTKSESIKKYISDDLYNEVKEVYSDYINTLHDICENYNGELSEEELMEIEWNNKRYEGIKEDIAKEISIEFIQNIFN